MVCHSCTIVRNVTKLIRNLLFTGWKQSAKSPLVGNKQSSVSWNENPMRGGLVNSIYVSHTFSVWSWKQPSASLLYLSVPVIILMHPYSFLLCLLLFPPPHLTPLLPVITPLLWDCWFPSLRGDGGMLEECNSNKCVNNVLIAEHTHGCFHREKQ